MTKRMVASDDEVRSTTADEDGMYTPVEFLGTHPFS